MRKTLADIRKICKFDRAAVRRLCRRLHGCGRALGLSAACLLVMLASGKLNFALAVDMGGDVIGYVSSREELDTIVETVKESVSGALGHEWDAPELTTRVTIGESAAIAEENAAIVADRLLETAENVASLSLVYVDGSAVCAFETEAEAAEALRSLTERYVDAQTETAAFAESVTVAQQIADRSLLENNLQALESAVTVVTVSHMTEEVVLPCETRTKTDDTLFEGECRVIRPGVEGLDVTESQVTKRDGETAETVLLRSEHYPPVQELVAEGTRTRVSTGDYIWPLETAAVSSEFGYRTGIGSSYHQGIDLAADWGSSIHAADGGTVIFAGEYRSYGLLVKLEHDNGDMTCYAHCSYLLVSEGDIVEQGEEIALVGTTGVSSGSHLHFEVHPGGGDAVDPRDCLPICPFATIG